MRIGIDARFLGPEGTGIGRYVEKLIENLELLDQENEYFIFLRKNNFPLYNPKNPNFKKITADARWYSLREQIIMPAALRAENLDLVHFPHFNIPLLYSGKFVVTIHDLTISNFTSPVASKHKAPIFYTKKLAYKFTLLQALKRAERIIVPTNFVKKEIASSFQVEPNKISVTPEAADNFTGIGETVSEGRVKEIYSKYSLKDSYILYVGNSYPYKNISRILETLPSLDPKISFVCVSARNSFLEKIEDRARELGVKNRVIFTGFVPDNDLKIILKRAVCFVFPSYSEGFGLPGLEAMAAGCPVISAKASSLPEVYGQAALYFDPDSVTELVEKINLIYKDTKVRKKLSALGTDQVKKYSWKKTAQETLSIYKEVLKI